MSHRVGWSENAVALFCSPSGAPPRSGARSSCSIWSASSRHSCAKSKYINRASNVTARLRARSQCWRSLRTSYAQKRAARSGCSGHHFTVVWRREPARISRNLRYGTVDDGEGASRGLKASSRGSRSNTGHEETWTFSRRRTGTLLH